MCHRGIVLREQMGRDKQRESCRKIQEKKKISSKGHFPQPDSLITDDGLSYI